MTSIADQTAHTKHSETFLETSNSQILGDVELGRLAVALYLVNLFRLWLIGHQVSKTSRHGCGWILQDELLAGFEAFTGVSMVDRHFRRLLKRGSGTFWIKSGDRLYLVGVASVAAELCIMAGLRGLESVIATNRPGDLKSSYIDISGNHQQFEANIYAAWLGSKNHTTIARATLESLWNRDQATIRRWERSHLRGLVQVVPGYATTKNISELPSDGATWNKRAGEYIWQLPNTYLMVNRQTDRNGQRHKVRAAVDGPGIGAGADTHKRYFDTYKAMRAAARRHGAAGNRFVFRGRWRDINFFWVGLDSNV